MANKKNYFALGKYFEIDNVRVLDFGTLFTLKCSGATFYDMKYIPAGKNKDGRKYSAFVSCPERKGSDGNYYKVYNLYFSDEDNDRIVAAVEAQIG